MTQITLLLLAIALISTQAFAKSDVLKSDCYGNLIEKVTEESDHDLHFKLLAAHKKFISILASRDFSDTNTQIYIAKIRTLTNKEKKVLFKTKSNKAVSIKNIVQLHIGSYEDYNTGLDGVAFMYAELIDNKITETSIQNNKKVTTWLSKYEVKRLFGFEQHEAKIVELNTSKDVSLYISYHLAHGTMPVCLGSKE